VPAGIIRRGDRCDKLERVTQPVGARGPTDASQPPDDYAAATEVPQDSGHPALDALAPPEAAMVQVSPDGPATLAASVIGLFKAEQMLMPGCPHCPLS